MFLSNGLKTYVECPCRFVNHLNFRPARSASLRAVLKSRHVAFAIDNDHRAVLAANQLDHIGHQAKRRLADAGATEDVEVLEQELEVNQDWVVIEKRASNDDRVSFLGVATAEKPFAVSVEPVPVVVLLISVGTFKCVVVGTNGRPGNEVRRQQYEKARRAKQQQIVQTRQKSHVKIAACYGPPQAEGVGILQQVLRENIGVKGAEEEPAVIIAKRQ